MHTQRKHVVVTGAAGRLGSQTAIDLSLGGYRVTRLRRSDLDISNALSVNTAIDALRPDVIVNCSAYNAVDAAESNVDQAFAINAHGPAALAAAAARVDAVLVHYSTDFVFDGVACEPYSEESPTNPLNVYGASKLAGEQEVGAIARHYILRVESLFGGRPLGQTATVDFIADKLCRGESVKAIIDRTVSPSHVGDVVRATVALIEGYAPFGTYHCVTSGSTNWYELAREISLYCGRGVVIPVEADEFPTIAPRPKYCALSNHKLRDVGVNMPAWRTALRRHLALRAVPAQAASARVTTT
jgi:dTDP-4-dehydrorhamnose reductase